MRQLAAFGMGLAACMQLLFAILGAGRGGFYVALQLVGLAGFAALAWGLAKPDAREGLAAMGVGFVLALAGRAASAGLGFSRLPLALNVALVLALALGAYAALMWTVRPQEAASYARGVRGALALLGVGFFVAAFAALGAGSFGPMLALTLGSVGFLLAAPNVEAPPVAEGRSFRSFVSSLVQR